MAKKVGKFIYWTPRILSLIFVLFLALTSLDVFEMNLGFLQTLLALLIHNIPAIILLIIAIISWKREIVGGIAFIIAGIAYIIAVLWNQKFEWYYLAWIIQISGVSFLIGILYLINWRRKKK